MRWAQAHALADYQSIGVLLSFIVAAQDATEWPGDAKPKRADFQAWNDLIWNTVLAGKAQAERRHLIKTGMTEAWVFSTWLTHAKSATWHDAESAGAVLACYVSLPTSILIRHLRSVPDQCLECGSPGLEPEEALHTAAPELVIERPCCVNCGWNGEPVVVDQRDDDELQELITREGQQEEGCVRPTVPLMDLVKPGERKG